jgi:hypothetical protein
LHAVQSFAGAWCLRALSFAFALGLREM